MPRKSAEQAPPKLVFTGVRSMWDTFYWIDDALGRHIQEFKAWPALLGAASKDEEPFDPIGRLEQLRADAQKLRKDLRSFELRFSLEDKVSFGPQKSTAITDLSADESSRLHSLNSRLDEVGRHIEAVFANIGEQLDQPLADPANRMTDYEVEAEVRFHLRDGDPGSQDHSDNQVAQVEISHGEHATEQWPDGYDSRCPVPHGGLFHELRLYGGYRMSRIDYRDMLRIGSVWLDVNVTHQFQFDIDAGRWIKRYELESDGSPGKVVYVDDV